MKEILLADLLADLSVLAAAQFAGGSFSLRRMLIAAAILACAALTKVPRIAAFAAWIIAAVVIADRRSAARISESAACLMLCALCAGGCAMIGGCAFPWAILGSGGCAAMLRLRRHIRARWNIEVILTVRGRTAAFPALIDTGNRLRDPSSGLPVLIAEKGAIEHLMEALPEDAFGSIPYSVLGSGGEIPCFAPDGIGFRFLGESERIAPPCRVAAFPGTIPGFARALAPPEFALAAKKRFKGGLWIGRKRAGRPQTSEK